MHLQHTNLRGRRRIAGTAALTLAVLGGAAVVSTGPAQADPAEDCATPAAIEDLVAGDAVTGSTVVEGTTPASFGGELLGVMADGIAPGVDMVLVEVDPATFSTPVPDEVDGIWQGMSGSPVYNADDELIGAVAYGLAYGNSWVAGVTPYDQMDDYLPAAGRRVDVSGRAARQIARGSGTTAAQASQGIVELQVPLGVSGVRSQRVQQAFTAQKKRDVRYLPQQAYQMAAAPAAAADVDIDTMIAGGNMAAALSFGDITQGGVGTATSVCDGKVVGFGHPAQFSGRTTMTLHPADAIHVQGDPLGSPFKVANLGAPGGTVTDDRTTGITARFGALPALTEITSTVSYGDRTREGSSFVSLPDANAQTTFFQQVAIHDIAIDGVQAGSELQSWTIRGTEKGRPFLLSSTDRFASDYDITFDASFELADFAYFLSSLKGVTVSEIEAESDVVDDAGTWRVSAVQQKRGGSWVPVKRRQPAVARAGKALVLRAVLTGGGDSMTVPVTFRVPKSVRGRIGFLSVTGGSWSGYYPEGGIDSVADLKKLVEKSPRNDAVTAGLEFDGRRHVVRQVVSDPTSRVVYGDRSVPVFVR
jgi:hypothetical protein